LSIGFGQKVQEIFNMGFEGNTSMTEQNENPASILLTENICSSVAYKMYKKREKFWKNLVKEGTAWTLDKAPEMGV
jgi:hypothetical protein